MRTSSRLRPLVALLTVAALAGAGCGSDDETTSGGGGENSVAIDMIDYGYVIEGELSQGWTTFDVTNSGDEYHMIGLARMKAGVTLPDVVTALTQGGEEGGGEGEGGDTTETTAEEQSLGALQLISAQTDTTETTVDGEDPGEPTQLDSTDSEEDTTGTGAEEGEMSTTSDESDGGEGGEGGGDPFTELFEDPEGISGPPGGFLAPGESISMTTDALEPGTYALICFISTPEGAPHFSRGMINELTIAESETPVGSAPTADVTVDIAAESIEMPTELTAGEHTFEVNIGADAEHELAFIRKNDADATLAELDEYFTEAFENEEGTIPTKDDFADAPAVFTGFVFSVSEGDTYYVTRTLTAGKWLIGCSLNEADESEDGTGRDHTLSEMAEVTVT